MTKTDRNSGQSGFTQSAGRSDILSLTDEASRVPRAAPNPQNQPQSHPQAGFPLAPGRRLAVHLYVVDGMFGKRHWAREWVLGLCKNDPLFLLHLADQSRGYVHFLCLVRLALPQHSDKDENLTCASLLRTHGKKHILQSIFPSCPKEILGVLPKLRKKPMSGKAYERLIKLLADSEIQKYLRHKKRVRRDDLALLELCQNLPEQLKTGKVIKCITEYGDYAYLLMVIRTADRFNIRMDKKEINQIVSNSKDVRRLGGLVVRKIKERPFPKPPWPGNDRIRPVCSEVKLQNVEAEFENCVETYLGKVYLGYSYFYVCKNPRAVIEVKKDAVFGWGIGDMEGVSRRKFSVEEIQRIIGAFSGADFYLRLPGRFDRFDEYWSILDRFDR